MKTTIDIRDDLLKAAKKRAIDEGVTLRAIIEAALEREISGLPPQPDDEVVPEWERGWGEGAGRLRALADSAAKRRVERHRHLGIPPEAWTLPTFNDLDSDLSLKIEELLAASWQED